MHLSWIRSLAVVALAVAMDVPTSIAQSARPCDPAGRWTNEEKTREIEISEVDGRWVGTVIWASQPDVLPGSVMLKDFVYNAKKERFEGKLTAPSGRELSAEMRCEAHDILKTTGRIGLMKRTVTWHRPDHVHH